MYYALAKQSPASPRTHTKNEQEAATFLAEVKNIVAAGLIRKLSLANHLKNLALGELAYLFLDAARDVKYMATKVLLPLMKVRCEYKLNF